jgi:hypothetical protein
MTNEQLETEIKHLASREQLEGLRSDLYKVKSDLVQMIWLTQISTVGIILTGVGLLIHFKI